MTAANFKSGFVTMIGRPNVGKSTLMNRLIGQKIAITSNKPQTTRNRIQTVYTDMERGQIVFLDTPGINKTKNKLGEYMVNVAEKTLNEVDVVLWLVEPSNFMGAGEQHIVEQLKKVQTPVILVINKVDTVEKDKVLEFIDTYRKIYDFAEIIPTSALRGQNVDDVIDSIFKYLPYGPQFYDEDTITDQPERAICAEIIREKALHALSDEVPHGIAVAIDQIEESEYTALVSGITKVKFHNLSELQSTSVGYENFISYIGNEDNIISAYQKLSEKYSLTYPEYWNSTEKDMIFIIWGMIIALMIVLNVIEVVRRKKEHRGIIIRIRH